MGNKCEACGQPGRIEFDTQGEGKFWLCGDNNPDHSSEIYCGVVLPDRRITALEAKLAKAREALEKITRCSMHLVRGYAQAALKELGNGLD